MLFCKNGSFYMIFQLGKNSFLQNIKIRIRIFQKLRQSTLILHIFSKKPLIGWNKKTFVWQKTKNHKKLTYFNAQEELFKLITSSLVLISTFFSLLWIFGIYLHIILCCCSKEYFPCIVRFTGKTSC